MSHTPDSIKVPKTTTPLSVYVGNTALLIAIWLFLATILSPILDWNFRWAALLTLGTLGGMILSGVIASDIPDWHSGVVFNPFTKTRRVVFQGLQWKLAWEALEHPLVWLKREISSGGTIKLPTNDPTETMDVTFLAHMRLDTTSDKPEVNAENIIRFSSVEEHTLKEVVDGEIVKMLSGHYSSKEKKPGTESAWGEMENLLDAREVQKAVFLDDAVNHARIHELSGKYGVHIGVVLKTSNPDERTKKLKETPARAEAFRTARNKLMTTGPNGEQPLGSDEAFRASLLLDDVVEYSEQHFTLKVDAPDLKNLRDVTIVPPGTLGGGGGKDKGKKGGRKS